MRGRRGEKKRGGEEKGWLRAVSAAGGGEDLWAVRWLAGRLGWLDIRHPDQVRRHPRSCPTPRPLPELGPPLACPLSMVLPLWLSLPVSASLRVAALRSPLFPSKRALIHTARWTL